METRMETSMTKNNAKLFSSAARDVKALGPADVAAVVDDAEW